MNRNLTPWDRPDHEAESPDPDEMVEVRYRRPSDLVSAMGAMAIWDAEILTRCDFNTQDIPTHTEKETVEYLQSRGEGGEMELTGKRRIWGWLTAESLCETFTGENPAAHISSRGASYNACLERLVMRGK